MSKLGFARQIPCLGACHFAHPKTQGFSGPIREHQLQIDEHGSCYSGGPKQLGINLAWKTRQRDCSFLGSSPCDHCILCIKEATKTRWECCCCRHSEVPAEIGSTQWLYWVYIGFILGLYWGYIGVILGLYWGYIGVILGLYWGYIGVVLGLYWVLLVLSFPPPNMNPHKTLLKEVLPNTDKLIWINVRDPLYLFEL